MRDAKRSRSESATGKSPRARWFVLGLAVVLMGAAAILAYRSARSPVDHRHQENLSSTARQPDAQSAALAHINTAPAPGPPPDGMAWIPGGTFWMGCDDCEMPDTQPVHLVTVDGFWMDRTPMTNAGFAEFVKATGYVTAAERNPDPKDYPGVDPSKLVAGSAVFTPPAQNVSLDDVSEWWHYVPGASWNHPDGPNSNIKGRDKYPVVQIAWEDAVAYAKWAGKRLPTEAEFEFASRGGLDRNRYAWGNDLKPGGMWVANIWQGRFPSNNTGDDGYVGASPVTAFPPNGFGLFDVGGNVWQWCSDWYRPDYFATLASQGVAHNPQGPPDSYDPQEPGVAKRVQKGGSFLCSDRYCSRYLAGSRGRGAVDSGGSNTGFRCVKSP